MSWFPKLKKGDGTIAIVGLGKKGGMGPGIGAALLAGLGGRLPGSALKLVLLDIDPDAMTKAKKIIARAFKIEDSDPLWERITFTSEYADIKDAELVVEAVTENLALKLKIYELIEAVVSEDCVIVSNSSNYPPEQLAVGMKQPGRFLNWHFFNPPARNPVVEVIAGEKTYDGLVGASLRLLHGAQRFAFEVGSSPAYALNPIYEALAIACIGIVDRGMGTPDQIDKVTVAVLGVPLFATLDMIAANDILPVACDVVGKGGIVPWMQAVPEVLRDLIESPAPWRTVEDLATVELEEELRQYIAGVVAAVFLSVTGKIIEAGIAERDELERAIGLAFTMKSPSVVARSVGGPNEVLGLIAKFADLFPGIHVPESYIADIYHRDVPLASMRTEGSVAIITLENTARGNSLSPDVLSALRNCLDDIHGIEAVRSIVITSHCGLFSAGADVKTIAKTLSDLAAVRALIESGKELFAEIRSSSKPVVVALQGSAFGGGFELALHADARIATPLVQVGLPEITLGIIPGWRGVVLLLQLLAHNVSVAIGAIRSGRPFTAAKALELGIVDAVVAPGELLEVAVAKAESLAQSSPTKRGYTTLELPAELDPSPFSPAPAADAIVCDLIRALADANDLPEASDLETEAFLTAAGTEDATIGVQNFLTTKGKQPAQFTGKGMATV